MRIASRRGPRATHGGVGKERTIDPRTKPSYPILFFGQLAVEKAGSIKFDKKKFTLK
jgi:hypothetical protein